MKTKFDPVDPAHDAAVHVSRQQQAIDEARESTSKPPPGKS
jgi:hypothetical protein